MKKEDYERIGRNFSKTINERAIDTLKRYGLTVKDLQQMYFGNKKLCVDEAESYADLAGDLNFYEGIHRLVKTQVEMSTTPTYFYEFCYDKEMTSTRALLTVKLKGEYLDLFSKNFTRSLYIMPIISTGACHFDEVEFLFHLNLRSQLGFTPYRKGTTSHKVMMMMTELWTNFAMNGYEY